MHRVCCCGGCPQSCCDLWSCSPSGPINITLSGTSDTRSVCDNGQELVHEEVFWEITATLTRSGRNCNVYYFSANTANLEITYKRRIFTTTIGAVCDAPPAPCQYDHCTDCICGTPQAAVCKLTEWTYNGPINGGGGSCLNADARYAALVPSGAVLTIACAANHCDHPCVNPVLLWTPADVCESDPCGGQPGGCKPFTKTITCNPVACCDQDPECGTSASEDVCLSCFVLVGRGCLNADTFTGARASPYTGPGAPPTFGDPNPEFTMSGFPYTAAVTYCGVNGDPTANQWIGPGTCESFDKQTKNCDYCWYALPDSVMTCYRLDPANPGNVLVICTPQPPCCSMRTKQAITWNLS